MKVKQNYSSIISFVLILSIVISPVVLIPKKVQAQSIAGYTSGLAPAIASLPQCKEEIGGAISGLFDGVGGLFSGGEGLAEEAGVKSLADMAGSLTSEFDSVKVNLAGTAEGKAILETNERTKKLEASAASIRSNTNCIQSIGRLVIKMLLQKLTVSTVAWINSGFDGSPAFIQDPGKFFEDIAKNEILQFGLEINNPELFPFGKAWMQNTATAFNKKFQDNAQYSLNELIQSTTPEYSAETFTEDFSQGGWNAWTAMTQVPANNPLGFKLMADNEIQRRLAGTTQSTAETVRDMLEQADGFLGDQRCVDPEGVTREQHNAALVKGEKDGEGNIVGTCKEWEYVTPGKLVSEAATNAIGYQQNVYLDAEDLNDAVAAIVDALLSQFSSNIMEKGFANLGEQGIDGALIYDDSGLDGLSMSQTEKDFAPSQLTSSWLKANPKFNIRTDLTQALIDEQRTYINKLKLQNKELFSTTDGKDYKLDTTTGFSNAYGLLPAIYQLDYCIPGPHPGWEQDARKTLSDLLIPGINSTPTAGPGLFTTILNSIPIIGGLLGSIFGDTTDQGELTYEARKHYSQIFLSLTGYQPRIRNSVTNIDPHENSMTSQSGLIQVFNRILIKYEEIMNKTYFSSDELLPSVAKESEIEFRKTGGYNQMIENNKEKISLLGTTVNMLNEIKIAVDSLNEDLLLNNITEAEYEENLKVQINAFGRLSVGMVNGNDIASADNMLKQIIDKKEYIYKNLIRGPYGCEAFLANPSNIASFPSANPGVQHSSNDWNNYNVNTVKRMTYPLPIIYDYNLFANGVEIEEKYPWVSGYKNRIPTTRDNNLGPGFLSFVLYTRLGGNSNGVFSGSERLNLSGGIVDTWDAPTFNFRIGAATDFIRLFRKSGPTYHFPNVTKPTLTAQPFEETMGIY